MLNAQKDRITQLEEAIETTINGLEWWKDEHPLLFDKADHEHLGNLQELIANKKLKP